MAARFKVPGTFTVPSTIEGVVGLLSARGWERAAIVYAYTKPAQGQRADLPENSGKLPTEFPCSMAAFARLGISGLRDEATVKQYRDRWQEAMRKRKAKAVRPGETVPVPDLPWPPTGHPAYAQTDYADDYRSEAVRTGTTLDAARRAGASPAAIEAAVAADPKAREAASRGIARHYEKRERKIRDDFGAKGKPAVDPAYVAVDDGQGGVLGEALTALDVEIQNDERAAWIAALVRASKALVTNVRKGVAKYEFTTVAAEVEQLHSIQANLTEAAFAFDAGFMAVHEEAGK